MELTEEQQRIVEMVVCRATNKEIATKMGYSTRSINRRLKAIYKALGVNDRVDLITQFKSI